MQGMIDKNIDTNTCSHTHACTRMLVFNHSCIVKVSRSMDKTLIYLYPTNLTACASVLSGRGGWVTYYGSGERKGGNEKRATEMSEEVI